MKSRNLVSVVIATALITTPVSRASADAGNLVGGIVGGIVAGAIINGANNKRTPPRRVVVANPANTAARARNRETQTALNYFGFPAGTPDGVLGRRSRAAVSSMQAYLGNPVTGKLTAFERDILVGAYNRGIAGSFETVQLVSKSPDGARSLLIAQRDFMTGGSTPTRTAGYAGLPLEVSEAVDEIAESSDPSAEQLLQRSGFIQLADLNGDGNNDYILDTSFAGSSFWCNSVQCKSLVFVSTPQGYRRNDLLKANPTPASFSCIGGTCTVASETVMASGETATTETAPVTTLTALPTFGAVATGPSLASHCTKVAMGSGADGMIVQAAAINDPGLVLDQQFCVARQSAIDEESRLIAQLGLTTAQVDGQCQQYGAALKPHVATLGRQSRDAMIAEIEGFVAASGVAPDQLYSTARICMGAGYRLDDMDIAIGTGLLLVQLGDAPYGELMGHHLNAGIGAAQQSDLSMQWFAFALDAQANGAPPVFGTSQLGRAALIQAALDMQNGTGAPVLQPIQASGGAKAKLPSIGKEKK